MPPTTIHVRPTGVPDKTTPGVETRDLARLFRRSPALAGVTIQVVSGRAVAILGANGAGKTTLLRVLATALRPSYGSAAVDGIDVADRPEEIRPRVAFLPHATGLYDDLTAAENLGFAAALMNVPAPDREDRVGAALERVHLTTERDSRVGRFSAGMRRRLALGRILLGHPRLVLLDEPYAALDAEGMALVDELLDEWRSNGATVLVATHATERLGERMDGWMRLENGLVVDLGGVGVIGRVAARPATDLPASPPLAAGFRS
ncbi:MAG TPA: heme ABC exporter ATP-binding protein CcmA [Candidatus Limnocylindria bacterium]|nr:heme ABC exporter ATP-binding protein CcmA [Candidatus Limnocylindria bacterium]